MHTCERNTPLKVERSLLGCDKQRESASAVARQLLKRTRSLRSGIIGLFLGEYEYDKI